MTASPSLEPSEAGSPILMRREHDLLGERLVPDTAYWGIHTLRAQENFAITRTPISTYPVLVNALACVKQAAAQANRDLEGIEGLMASAIIGACEEIRAGRLHDQFVVDVVQGGAGTSTNMNANEVIANRALELLGHARGDYQVVHPLDHVNMSQSTNDAYPTALKIATHESITRLRAALDGLRNAFKVKAVELNDVIKMGRTQLQDAVPMTMGQEFAAYAVTIGEDIDRLSEAQQLVTEINMGATAVGTGITAHPDYAARVRAHLSTITGIELKTSPDLIEATQDVGSFVQLSGVLKRVAVKLSKICNDLRLLSSGPRAGLGEIRLPAVQAGSSIMPGKVNPVIPEAVNQIAYEVIGHDVTISLAAEGGQLQLNAFEPIIAHSLFQSIEHLTAGCTMLENFCVIGITANREHLQQTVQRSIGLVTALTPAIGYAAATQIASMAIESDRTIRDLVLETGIMDADQLDNLLRPANLTTPNRASQQPC